VTPTFMTGRPRDCSGLGAGLSRLGIGESPPNFCPGNWLHCSAIEFRQHGSLRLPRRPKRRRPFSVSRPSSNDPASIGRASVVSANASSRTSAASRFMHRFVTRSCCPWPLSLGGQKGNRVGEPRFGSTVPRGCVQLAFEAVALPERATRDLRRRKPSTVCQFDERLRAAHCAARVAARAAVGTVGGGKWA
jgi:hypothetical protein